MMDHAHGSKDIDIKHLLHGGYVCIDGSHGIGFKECLVLKKVRPLGIGFQYRFHYQ